MQLTIVSVNTKRPEPTRHKGRITVVAMRYAQHGVSTVNCERNLINNRQNACQLAASFRHDIDVIGSICKYMYNIYTNMI